MFKPIPAGWSCTTICASFGLDCLRRHSDGFNPRCQHFNTNSRIEECSEVQPDDDDVCVCKTPPPTAAPTQQPTLAPSAAPTQAPTLAPTAPTATPTAAPTASPTSAPTLATACTVLRDSPMVQEVCDDVCVDGVCNCAAVFKPIPSGWSCSTVCQSFGLTCVGRHSDSYNPRCKNYFSNSMVEECADVQNDNDDVCVCSDNGVISTERELRLAAEAAALEQAAKEAALAALLLSSASGLDSGSGGFSDDDQASGFGATLSVVVPKNVETTTSTTTTTVLSACDILQTSPFASEVCGEVCTDGYCECGAVFDKIPEGWSCDTLCSSTGLVCTARYSDALEPRCAHYDAQTRKEPCGAVQGDSDDVCVCASTGSALEAKVTGGADTRGPRPGATAVHGAVVASVAVALLVVMGMIIAVVRYRRGLREAGADLDDLNWDNASTIPADRISARLSSFEN